MHDPKFESEVQQKMEGLEFPPSEAVWVNLQRELHKEKRRRMPLPWFFFLLGGMLLGATGAGLFISHGHISGAIVTAQTTIATAPATVVAPPAPAPAAPALIGSAPVPAGSATVSTTPAHDPIAPSTVFSSPSLSTVATGTTGGDISPAMKTTKWDKAFAHSPAISGITHTRKQEWRPTAANDRERTGSIDREGQQQGLNDRKTAAVAEETSLAAAEPSLRRTEVTVMRAPVRINAGADPITDFDRTWTIRAKKSFPNQSLASSGKASKKAKLTRTPSWEAGFTGGGGISSTSGSTDPVTSSAASDLPLSPRPAAAIYTLTSNGAPQQTQVSRTQPGSSFWAGIFVQKPVLKKISLTIGLNLHYYSTRTQTGEKITSSPTQTSLFSASPYVQPAAAQVVPYYTPGKGNEYRNRYYFLAIPVSLQWQFNHSRTLPLFWEGGLSLSRLVSSNALYFDEKSRVYYKNGQTANPTHLLAFTSVMAGLSWRGNLIQVGPQIQYGLTSLTSANGAGGQHLFYGGIRIAVIPKRW